MDKPEVFPKTQMSGDKISNDEQAFKISIYA